ncbi:hypothetical protein SAMN05444163_8093 [Bradyrhizobium ottawaense]|uniref:Uncharacterized protein n=1 Tax=Bradyrhizobium ottawaense TaxID=931866 RepID=A0ABY0QHA4_9BRAD|nr:hypothetical protein SAMN05444163_8093 [Bradyrhizobium ottawaense]
MNMRPTLTVVMLDGTVERVRMRSLRIARHAAFLMNEGGRYRAAFARMMPVVPLGWQAV